MSAKLCSIECDKTFRNGVESFGPHMVEASINVFFSFFYVSLTVHLTITLANDQLDAQIFNTFIILLYMYMFRTISCSSSGGQIVLIQHLVSSLSVSDRPVHRLRKKKRKSYFSTCAPDGHLLRVTIPGAVLIQSDLLRMSKILLETCRGLS